MSIALTMMTGPRSCMPPITVTSSTLELIKAGAALEKGYKDGIWRSGRFEDLSLGTRSGGLLKRLFTRYSF